MIKIQIVDERSSTVEPILGTLINHHNMKRINARGLPQANKHILMAALTYNLKKLLRFVPITRKCIKNVMEIPKKQLENSLKGHHLYFFASMISN